MYIDFWFIQSNYCELFHCIFSPFPLHLHADRSATRYSHPNKIIWYIFGYQNAKRISTLKVTFYPTTCFIILLFLSVMPLLQSSYLVDPPQQKSLVSPSLGTRPSADHSLLSVSSPQRPEDNRDQETMFWSQSHTPLIQQRYMRCFKINEPILPKYTRVVLHHLGEAPIVVDHRPPRVSSHPFMHQDKKHFFSACLLHFDSSNWSFPTYEWHCKCLLVGDCGLILPHPDFLVTKLIQGLEDVRGHDEGVNIRGDHHVLVTNDRMEVGGDKTGHLHTRCQDLAYWIHFTWDESTQPGSVTRKTITEAPRLINSALNLSSSGSRSTVSELVMMVSTTRALVTECHSWMECQAAVVYGYWALPWREVLPSQHRHEEHNW